MIMMMSNDHILHHTDCKSPQLLLSLYSCMSSQDKALSTLDDQPITAKLSKIPLYWPSWFNRNSFTRANEMAWLQIIGKLHATSQSWWASRLFLTLSSFPTEWTEIQSNIGCCGSYPCLCKLFSHQTEINRPQNDFLWIFDLIVWWQNKHAYKPVEIKSTGMGAWLDLMQKPTLQAFTLLKSSINHP